MAREVLTTRALNRALLGRQLLLERRRMAPGDALEHLVGMQAQNPLDPYFGLWSRLEAFDPFELSTLVERTEVVRAWLMRGTIHMVTDRDCLALRPVMDSVMRKTVQAQKFGRDVAGVEQAELIAATEEILADGALTRAEIGRRLAERWPELPAESLGLAASYLVPMLQVPPRGTWRATHRATQAHVERFLGRALGDEDDPSEAIVRYLRAFGPAAPKDVRAWSYKTGLREVIDRLRPELVTYRDEGGTELLDVPGGLFPDPETPAPPRFLPEFDNALLSHDDRSRVIPPGEPARTWWKGTVLIDGFAAGTWRLEREKEATTLAIGSWGRWRTADREDVADEGERLLAFAAADAERTAIRFEQLD
jgi:Winged helix DNA-binding domain